MPSNVGSQRPFLLYRRQSATLLFSTTTSNDEKEASTVTTEKVNDGTNTTTSLDENSADNVEEEDDEEYEYIEYEDLTENDFVGSEWLVGTCWNNNENEIKETWVRLAFKEDKNIAVWGDDSEGTWSLDVASQFLAVSKEFLWGKQIWAGVVDDYYFVQGTVRGWTYLTPASVLGQWQAKRLGVDPDEAGTAPWFLVDDDDGEEAEDKADEDDNTDDKVTESKD